MSVSAIGGTFAAQHGFATPKTNTIVVTTQPAGPSLSTVKDSDGHVIATSSIGPASGQSKAGVNGASIHVTA